MSPREVAFLYSAWLDRLMAEDLRAATIACAVYNSSMNKDQTSRAVEPSDIFRTIPKRKIGRISEKTLAKKIVGLAK